MKRIQILIVGVGNIGKSAIKRLPKYPDLELAGIVTRRVEQVKELGYECPIYDLEDDYQWSNCGADVALLCGGSRTDLPLQGPLFARLYPTVCSFDNHGHIGPYRNEDTEEDMVGYFAEMDGAAIGLNPAIISVGWDPGLFSMARALITACMPEATPYAFYGLTEKGGLSMGHSDAIRRIEGVKDARSYTHTINDALIQACGGKNPKLPPTSRHWRECLVVLEDGADQAAIEKAIRNMPEYFAGYETTIKFVSQAEIDKRDSMYHDGLVVGVGEPGVIELRNEWVSNPEATASIMLAFARAAYQMKQRGQTGAFTALDVPIRYLLPNEGSHIDLI